MTDIVEWLREVNSETNPYVNPVVKGWCYEAADEIERLRKERDEARDALATARRDARNDALEEAARRIDEAHLECCDPERYDKGECCGDFITAQEAIRQL